MRHDGLVIHSLRPFQTDVRAMTKSYSRDLREHDESDPTRQTTMSGARPRGHKKSPLLVKAQGRWRDAAAPRCFADRQHKGTSRVRPRTAHDRPRQARPEGA